MEQKTKKKNTKTAELKINAETEVQRKAKVKERKKVKRDAKKEKNKKLLEHIKKNKKKYITILGILLAVFAISFLVWYINRYFIDKKYAKYEEKMDIYGFDLLYNNQSPESYEKVTKFEAVKIVLGSIYNTNDATYIGYMPSGEYDGDEWVKTAEAFGVLKKGKINKENLDEYISYWDFIKLFIDTRNKKLDIATSYTKESSFKNLNAHSQEQQQYINDLVENNLLENSKKKIDLDAPVIKGQINEIVVKYVDKYNSIVDEDETLVTKKESMPKNADEYPYIVYSIPNEVYEMDFMVDDSEGYKSPRELYKTKKEYYNQMEYRITNYYKAILNINYENINVESFRNSVDEYLLYNYSNEIFQEYVQYVKDNKIILEGKAEPQIPIVYYDGINMRIRTKITFKIVNSLTDKNVVFGDIHEKRENPVTYKNKEYSFYAEVPMSRLLDVVSYRTEIKSMINILSDRSKIKDNAI